MEDTKVKVFSMDTIETQKVKWLWYPYIPFGKMTIVQGDPGEGKTTFVLKLAAKLSKGEHFDPEQALEPMNIIYQTAEDGLADTVKPRLEEAGADCSRILVIDESDKPLDMTDERLELAIKQTGARLLILDPIQAFLGAKVDMNRANETRNVTQKLGDIAERTGCAIILIGHMNKASQGKAAYRGIGSIDFFAVVRSVLLIGRDPKAESVRCVVQIKNNLAMQGDTVAFRLSENGFEWIGSYDISTDELLSGYSTGDKKIQAEGLIRSELLDGKQVPSTTMIEKAKQLGISERTMETVKKDMGVKSIKDGLTWKWAM